MKDPKGQAVWTYNSIMATTVWKWFKISAERHHHRGFPRPGSEYVVGCCVVHGCIQVVPKTTWTLFPLYSSDGQNYENVDTEPGVVPHHSLNFTTELAHTQTWIEGKLRKSVKRWMIRCWWQMLLQMIFSCVFYTATTTRTVGWRYTILCRARVKNNALFGVLWWQCDDLYDVDCILLWLIESLERINDFFYDSIQFC